MTMTPEERGERTGKERLDWGNGRCHPEHDCPFEDSRRKDCAKYCPRNCPFA